MRKFLAGTAATALGLALVQAAPAQDQKPADSAERPGQTREQSRNEPKTIRGKVVAVTLVGESVVDYEHNRAVVTQVPLLTILGSESSGKMQADEQKHASGGQAGDDQGKAEEGSGTGSDSQARSQNGSDSARGGGRDNLYILAVTPQTTFREADQQQQEKERGQGDSPQRGEHSRPGSNHEGLEIGDCVEVEFRTTGAMSDHSRGEPGAAESKASKPDQSGSQESASKESDDKARSAKRNGRDRVIPGQAVAIRLFPDDSFLQKGSSGQRPEGEQKASGN